MILFVKIGLYVKVGRHGSMAVLGKFCRFGPGWSCLCGPSGTGNCEPNTSRSGNSN